MGLFKKMKDILFDEEEYTAPIKITPEMRNEDIPMKDTKDSFEDDKPNNTFKNNENDNNKKEVYNEIKRETTSERELFNSSSFPLDFDELEFNNRQTAPAPKVQEERKPVNTYEIERRKRIEKRTNFGPYERIEVTETTDRKKFKPSPIISPVYGVLDKDYKKEDVLKKDEVKVSVEDVRNKAFGEKKQEVKEEPVTTYYEETETVTLIDPKEKEKKVKTIDELLEDTSDVVVDIDKDLDNIDETKKVESIEDEKDNTNDLFDLIDSMYDNNEDGE